MFSTGVSFDFGHGCLICYDFATLRQILVAYIAIVITAGRPSAYAVYRLSQASPWHLQPKVEQIRVPKNLTNQTPTTILT